MALSKEYIEKTRQKAGGWYAQAGIGQSEMESLEQFALPQKQDEPWRYFQPHHFIESALLAPTRPKTTSDSKQESVSLLLVDNRLTLSGPNKGLLEGLPQDLLQDGGTLPLSEAGKQDYWQSLMALGKLGSTYKSVRIKQSSTEALLFCLTREVSVSQSLQIVAAENTQATVYLRPDALRSGFTNLSLVVEKNAHLNILIEPKCYAGVHDFLRVHADVAKDASLKVHVTGSSSKQPSLGRVEWYIHLNEEGASAELSSLEQLGGECGKSHYLQIFHHAPSTSSKQKFRFVVDEKARASFHGGVKIDQGAKQASAQQLNNNLLLSDTAEVFTRPELQIEEDEVTCSHGATVADLDEGQQFYLCSRGLSPEVAHAHLVKAFGAAVVPEWAQTAAEKNT